MELHLCPTDTLSRYGQTELPAEKKGKIIETQSNFQLQCAARSCYTNLLFKPTNSSKHMVTNTARLLKVQ
jgi:hypothetical protein